MVKGLLLAVEVLVRVPLPLMPTGVPCARALGVANWAFRLLIGLAFGLPTEEGLMIQAAARFFPRPAAPRLRPANMSRGVLLFEEDARPDGDMNGLSWRTLTPTGVDGISRRFLLERTMSALGVDSATKRLARRLFENWRDEKKGVKKARTKRSKPA